MATRRSSLDGQISWRPSHPSDLRLQAAQTRDSACTVRSPSPRGSRRLPWITAMERQCMDSSLRRACVQAVQDATVTSQVHGMWTWLADHDVSRGRLFTLETCQLVRLQELALDAPNTAWTANMVNIWITFRAGTPDWTPPPVSGAETKVRGAFCERDQSASVSWTAARSLSLSLSLSLTI